MKTDSDIMKITMDERGIGPEVLTKIRMGH